jgi:hypothetical protein
MVDPSVQLGGLQLWSAMASFFSKESGSSTNADPAPRAKPERKATLTSKILRRSKSQPSKEG